MVSAQHRSTDPDLQTAAAHGREEGPAAQELASTIRDLRKRAGLSQAQLAATVGYTRQYVSNAERVSVGLPSAELVQAIDVALAADGALNDRRARAQTERRARRQVATTQPPARASTSSSAPAVPILVDDGTAPPIAADGTNGEITMTAPGGRFFTGSSIPAQICPAVDDGRIISTVPHGFMNDRFMRQARRSLVVGRVDGGESGQAFGLDVRHARRRLANGQDEARLIMSRSYALDDLTLGLLWALTNFDDPLLDDDADLFECSQQLSSFHPLTKSAGGREIAEDLSPASRMWLGSMFCAGHILRNFDTLDGTATFWTREQRGEEASSWLFFAHKYDYLQKTADLITGSGRNPARAFCIPRVSVESSPRAERILLLLTLALMESFGIRVDVSDEPEYASIKGFVLDERRRAIIANWVGLAGIWYVDSIQSGAQLGELVDATHYTRSHSAISSETSYGRLARLAEYLDLDLHWLTQRCAELQEYGVAPLIQPRSRLLSVDGVDRACRFLSGMRHAVSC